MRFLFISVIYAAFLSGCNVTACQDKDNESDSSDIIVSFATDLSVDITAREAVIDYLEKHNHPDLLVDVLYELPVVGSMASDIVIALRTVGRQEHADQLEQFELLNVSEFISGEFWSSLNKTIVIIREREE